MHKPRKRFGQHFLNDVQIIQQIIQMIQPKPGQHLVEIGPGHGALTFPLLKMHPDLMAVEIDRDLIDSLRLKSASNSGLKNLVLYQSDVLKFDFNLLPEPLRIIGNLPYNISTPLLFYLLKFKSRIHDMIFMLQKEVVERLCAAPHTKNYGRLSVMLQYECEIDFLLDVPKEAFYPVPKVNSAIVRLMPKKNPKFVHKIYFEKIVRECFSHRRKTLRNILNSLKYSLDKAAADILGIDLNARPENLSVKNYVDLANIFDAQQEH